MSATICPASTAPHTVNKNGHENSSLDNNNYYYI